MSRAERLKSWIDTLSEEQLKSILLEIVEELIDAQTVSFYDTSLVPYWDANGENLDGSENEGGED